MESSKKISYNNNYFRWTIEGFRILIVLTGILFLVQGKGSKIFNVLLTLFTTYAVEYIYKIFKIRFTEKMKFAIQVFIFFSMYLGKLFDFYSLIPNWDDFLHIASGLMLGMIGHTVLISIFHGEKYSLLSKGFICFFIILFGAACAGAWEIFEFSGDMILGLNSQGGSLLDTMFDIVNGTAGGTLVAILYYFKPGILEDKKS
ncbi:hypothetical protein [Clostridium polynesiense]|uniref:hypothetical protein n=1 Tax=Clostridium polynesiense TaxID=1325933 RepID=UPI0006932EA7|nr:hypothetical protein [Clostridium polynesiense]